VESTSVEFNAHPPPDRAWVVGTSREWGSSDIVVNSATVERIRRRALEFIPFLRDATLAKSRAGLRPAMPDHLPWIGPVTRRDQVWAATDHEGLGITCSLGTAQLAVEALLGRRPEISLTPYPARPDRAVLPSGPLSPDGGR
jgi:glycine/D-amino acid oxidase-like deaminating enzyme